MKNNGKCTKIAVQLTNTIVPLDNQTQSIGSYCVGVNSFNPKNNSDTNFLSY